ncbi:MAG: molybdopterin biosynthesis protein [Oscillospiraceae bacterium]|nr:molybdopterin biosynthesis protein [Oscillospiraceae bacterium]
MSFKYLTNIDLDTAREDYLAVLIEKGLVSGKETIAVTEAAGRVTKEAVYAKICAPHYNASAMDGIAVSARDTFGASETTPILLEPGQYKYIDTGDPLPEEFDAVVMIEDVISTEDYETKELETEEHITGGYITEKQAMDDRLAHDKPVKSATIKLYDSAAPWQHIRQIGEDICAGEMLLPSFSKVTPAAMGAMIASGVTELTVIKRPVVGFIPTGDEIIPPTANPKEGEILEFNSVIYTAMLKEWGAEAIKFPIVKDDAKLIKAAVETALSECDIVLIGAGSSAGREDYTASVISQVGTILYHGIAIKPGKPAILGYYDKNTTREKNNNSKEQNKDTHRSVVPLIGVPGYPVSGIIVLEQLLRPMLDYLCGANNQPYTYVEATLSKSVASTLKYREFVRVRLGYVKDKLIAAPLGRGSGVVTSFMRADGILEIPQEAEGYESGKKVNIRLMRNKEELHQSIVVIGSHDPLIDELSDLLRIKHGNISLGSAHVGSMSGILAVKKGEAHLAGTHLLDEETGEYNSSFIRRMIPDGGVKLIKCVKRKQGLMLPKGNPKGIKNIADLVKDGIRYVNRQKGSGTRILIDYLCKKDNIDTSNIYGYDREEFTHTSVAALIAAGSADVGLGIYSAAKIYDLEFIHICDEDYDFLIPDHAWEMPVVQELLALLESADFAKRLDALGGYILNDPGLLRVPCAPD